MQSNVAAPVAEQVDCTAVIAWWRRAVETNGETSLMAMVRSGILSGIGAVTLPGIHFNFDLDRLVFEYRLPHGRVDLAVFHSDGTLTLVEAKDGRFGLRHVVSGIGQVCMYALDVGMLSGRPRKIRKALLWSSTGDIAQDVMIEMCCEQAGVIPMAFGCIDTQLDITRRSLALLEA